MNQQPRLNGRNNFKRSIPFIFLWKMFFKKCFLNCPHQNSTEMQEKYRENLIASSEIIISYYCRYISRHIKGFLDSYFDTYFKNSKPFHFLGQWNIGFILKVFIKFRWHDENKLILTIHVRDKHIVGILEGL